MLGFDKAQLLQRLHLVYMQVQSALFSPWSSSEQSQVLFILTEKHQGPLVDSPLGPVSCLKDAWFCFLFGCEVFSSSFAKQRCLILLSLINY